MPLIKSEAMAQAAATSVAKPTQSQLRLLELAARNQLAEEDGSPTRRASEAAAGKLSARERIDVLLDEGTFEETGKFVTHRAAEFGMAAQRPLGDGIIAGHGRMHGRVVFVFAHDYTIFNGSLSEANTAKIAALLDTAMHVGAPVIGLIESSGVRLQEGLPALAGYADTLLRNTLASGLIPQISAIFGPCNGTAALSPALTDFTLTTGQTSPTGSAAHFLAPHDRATLATLRELLAFLPSSFRDTPPRQPTNDPAHRADLALDTLIPETLIPDTLTHPYNMLDVITKVVDDTHLFQVHEHFAKNIVTGFAHMDGRAVGVVANQPAVLDGILDADASTKAARFVRFCDAFNIPLIVFEDSPGLQQEQAAILYSARLLYAFAEATVPRLTVITRKAYGAAYCIMNSRHLRADLNLAWPSAEFTVLAPEDAVDLLHKREFDSALKTAEAVWPQGKSFTEEEKVNLLADLRKERTDDFRERFAHPYLAAERGYVDAVIRPSETRRRLNQALDLLATKQPSNAAKKHGNIPL